MLSNRTIQNLGNSMNLKLDCLLKQNTWSIVCSWEVASDTEILNGCLIKSITDEWTNQKIES